VVVAGAVVVDLLVDLDITMEVDMVDLAAIKV